MALNCPLIKDVKRAHLTAILRSTDDYFWSIQKEIYLFSKNNDGVVIADGLRIIPRVFDDPWYGIPDGPIIAGCKVMLSKKDIQVFRYLYLNGAMRGCQNVPSKESGMSLRTGLKKFETRGFLYVGNLTNLVDTRDPPQNGMCLLFLTRAACQGYSLGRVYWPPMTRTGTFGRFGTPQLHW